MEPNLLMWAKYSHYNGVRIKEVKNLYVICYPETKKTFLTFLKKGRYQSVSLDWLQCSVSIISVSFHFPDKTYTH